MEYYYIIRYGCKIDAEGGSYRPYKSSVGFVPKYQKENDKVKLQSSNKDQRGKNGDVPETHIKRIQLNTNCWCCQNINFSGLSHIRQPWIPQFLLYQSLNSTFFRISCQNRHRRNNIVLVSCMVPIEKLTMGKEKYKCRQYQED